ncbi:hypothetical protein LguiB_005907 [Lonicera macranthoides]
MGSVHQAKIPIFALLHFSSKINSNALETSKISFQDTYFWENSKYDNLKLI